MHWKRHVRLALNGEHPVLGARIEFLLLGLIVFSVLSAGIATFPNLPAWVNNLLFYTGVVIVVIFTIEYLLRLITAPHVFSYVRSVYGIIDLLAIAPFYLGLVFIGIGLDFRMVRMLRLFRLLPLLKLARYNRAAERFAAAWRDVKEEIVIFSIVAVAVLYICALIIYYFEHQAQPEAFASVFDALWWAAITLTTVGYGDIYPVTPLGRVFTVLMLFIALGIIAVPTGLVASALTSAENAPAVKDDSEASAKQSKNAL